MRNKYVLKGDVVRSGQAVRVFWTGYDWSPNLANAAHFATEFAARTSHEVASMVSLASVWKRCQFVGDAVVQNVRTCEL
jgi:hypothetical protein